MRKTIEFNVTGMTCDHCVRSVTNAIEEIDGVAEVSVSLDEKLARVTGETIDVDKVIAAVKEEGYEAAVR